MYQEYAFALGYYQGRVVGVWENEDIRDWDFNSQHQHFYKLGYDVGVADYCKDEEQTEEKQND